MCKEMDEYFVVQYFKEDFHAKATFCILYRNTVRI
jgi:hypothetical protein